MAAIESTIVVVACRRILGISLGRVTVLPVAVFAVSYVAGHGTGDLVGAHTTGWAAPTVAAAVVAAAVSLGLAAVVALRPFQSLWQAARRPAPIDPVPAGAPA